MPVSGVLECLFKYWQGLSRVGANRLPLRAALNPAELSELLPRVALLKRLDRYNVQASMMNMSDSHLWQRPFVGMNAFDLTAPDIRESRAEFYEAILDHPAAAHLTESVMQKEGKQATVKSLYLPLADKLGFATYILACSVYDNQSNNLNDRMVLDHENVKELEFIDIGYGTPQMQFERPEPRTVEDNIPNWWQRIMPNIAKANTSDRLDS